MSISAAQIKELREKTGVGILDCRSALEEGNGDFDKAVVILREKGLAKAASRSGRDTSNGMLELYSHGGGRVGVLVEVNCETDFVALTDGFKSFAHEIALQIAAANPRYLTEEDVPEDVVAQEREIARKLALQEGKPENIVDRIIDGRMKKFFSENCLVLQTYIRDDDKTVQDLIKETVASTGESIVIRRFERWELGEEL
jgi:elongation factor Ts